MTVCTFKMLMRLQYQHQTVTVTHPHAHRRQDRVWVLVLQCSIKTWLTVTHCQLEVLRQAVLSHGWLCKIPTTAPASIEKAVLGPMIMPCPMYPIEGVTSHPQSVTTLIPSHVAMGKLCMAGIQDASSVYTLAAAKDHSSAFQAASQSV